MRLRDPGAARRWQGNELYFASLAVTDGIDTSVLCGCQVESRKNSNEMEYTKENRENEVNGRCCHIENFRNTRISQWTRLRSA